MAVIKGQIIKAVGGFCDVKTDEGIKSCSLKGVVKRDGDILVGDLVTVSEGVVTAVLPRKNSLIRPAVANIDLFIIMLAEKPKPDFLLAEKLLLFCFMRKIDCIICFNKTDIISQEKKEELLRQYPDIDVHFCSAKDGDGIENLKKIINGKIVCFGGQSAVGKSSVISLLINRDLQTGELSQKLQRGKNTTRHIEIFSTDNGQIIDTCGFSLFDEGIDIRYDELIYYYSEFLPYQNKCKFANCTHTTEPCCEVKAAVANGLINKARYERYLSLYAELKKLWRNRYV